MFSDTQKFIVSGEDFKHLILVVSLVLNMDSSSSNRSQVKGYTFDEENQRVVLYNQTGQGAEDMPDYLSLETFLHMAWDFLSSHKVRQEFAAKNKNSFSSMDGSSDYGWLVRRPTWEDRLGNSWTVLAIIEPAWMYYSK